MSRRSRDSYPPTESELQWDFDKEHGILDASEDEYRAATGYGNAKEAMEAIKAGKPLKPKKTEIEALKEEILKLKKRVRELETGVKTIKRREEMDEDDRDAEDCRYGRGCR